MTICSFVCPVQNPLVQPTCIIIQKVEWPEQYPSVVHALWRKSSQSLCMPCCHPLWRLAQSMKRVNQSHQSAGVKKASKPLGSTLRQMVQVRIYNLCVFLLNLLLLKCFSLELKLSSLTSSSFPEIFALQSFWPVFSVIHSTVYWPQWEGVTSAFGRCVRPCVAASPPPCSLFWTSPHTVTSVGVWAFAASCVTVLSATSAFRLQSAWTLLWKSLKCFTTNAGRM